MSRRASSRFGRLIRLAAWWLLAVSSGVNARAADPHPVAPVKPATAPHAEVAPATEEFVPSSTLSPASQVDSLISTNLVRLKRPVAKAADRTQIYQDQVDNARELRRRHDTVGATRVLVELLENETPTEFKRAALFELALVAQEENQLPRAQQVFSQFLQLFPKDPSVPEVLLRQGLNYRLMGANQLAIAKFYAVMNSALNMKLDQLDYYARLVLQAQTEIADTFFLQGQFADATEFYERLLKQNAPELNRTHIQFKLLRCLAGENKHAAVTVRAENFARDFPEAGELSEVRFLHAQALQKLGRSREALTQVALILKAQQDTASQSPEHWIYWRQRIGNGIANQLYQDGDYLNALDLYTHLAELDPSPGWQLPAWYQIGLIHERLQQPQKAAASFDAILAREKELAGSTNTPSLKAVVEMAKWRKAHLVWETTAEQAMQSLKLDFLRRASTNAPTLAQP